jgi:hypothetical protein
MPALPDATVRILVSYYYYKKRDLAEVAGWTDRPFRFFADSGAYSAFTLRGSSGPIKVADYAAWLTQWRPLLSVMANLDVIGDPKGTARNQLALEGRGFPVVPVWHGSSPWSELEALCRDYDYVAVGGTASLHGRSKQMLEFSAKAALIARDHGAVLHGFGRSGTELAQIPFYSVDASSWMRGAQFGHLQLFDGGKIRAVGIPDAAKEPRLLRKHGINPALVTRSDFANRNTRTDVALYREEKAASLFAATVAWKRYEAYLRRRHHVPAPAGHTTPGTVIYLADNQTRHLQSMMRAVAWLATEEATA